MKELCVYMEVDGLAQSEDGTPAPAGVKISLGFVPDTTDVDVARFNADREARSLTLQLAQLDGIAKPEDVHILAKEAYEREYGGDTDEEAD